MRAKRRQMKKNSKLPSLIIRSIILIVICYIIFYICYGVYKENQIRLVENEQNTKIIIERVSKTEEAKPKEKVNIPEKYQNFAVTAKLIIPKINLASYVLQDYTTEGMEVCLSKYWGPEPNEIGNFCIAGHNYEKSNMFNHLIDLEIGDALYLLDNKNGKHAYTIYDIYKVKPKNTAPIGQEVAGKKVITLITCVNYSRNRLIVQAIED